MIALGIRGAEGGGKFARARVIPGVGVEKAGLAVRAGIRVGALVDEVLGVAVLLRQLRVAVDRELVHRLDNGR